MQDAAITEWNSMQRSAQDVYKMNLDALIALKTKLMNGDVIGTTLHPRLMDWII
jgi:hypothetical protein